MLKPCLGVLLLTVVLAGCAHRGAARIECEGPLRPINRPVPLKDAPVSVSPADSNTSTSTETRP
jgi:hypothetical protein